MAAWAFGGVGPTGGAVVVETTARTCEVRHLACPGLLALAALPCAAGPMPSDYPARGEVSRMDRRLPRPSGVAGKHPRRTGAAPPPAPRRQPGRWLLFSWRRGVVGDRAELMERAHVLAHVRQRLVHSFASSMGDASARCPSRGASSAWARRRLNDESPAAAGLSRDGPYWARTSDLRLVEPLRATRK